VLEIESDPYAMFIFAMNAPQTREKYVTRLERFFDFIDLPGSTIEERCNSFAKKGKTCEYPDTIKDTIFASR
jgi:hypothetical protein